MKTFTSLLISLLPFFTLAKNNYFQVNIFEQSIDVPTSCVLQIREDSEPTTLAFYKCDEETNLLISKFNYKSIMDLQNAYETTKHTESKIGDLTHFHIEASIDTPDGESVNFIDAFCDAQFCIIPLGPSEHIANGIKAQLQSMPNKKIKSD